MSRTETELSKGSGETSDFLNGSEDWSDSGLEEDEEEEVSRPTHFTSDFSLWWNVLLKSWVVKMVELMSLQLLFSIYVMVGGYI
mmetsp:Transcript_21396/g.26260  ORF Transcript_21396/g.26260 Transcript_21396/m.26260 type:complete len:84 (+) Transcript_21396:15-266(+)